MWIAPPSGLRRISAATTWSVSCAVRSRTRAEAALCPPLTARNALVTAMAIFEGSKPTTAPLRRMTLYWASRGSVFTASVALGSPAVCFSCVTRGGVAAGLATCMVRSPGEILSLLARGPHKTRNGEFRGMRLFRRPDPLAHALAPGPLLYGPRKSLRNQNYYILC